MSPRRSVWLLPLLVAAFVSSSPQPALASCAEPLALEEAIASAATVFVGTVTGVRFDGRVATFNVEEVWKGEIGASVVVSGGPSLAELEAAQKDGLGLVTSVDRSYEQGIRYLVVSQGSVSGVLSDNNCSATQPFSLELDRFRPATAQAPTAPPADDAPASRAPEAWSWVTVSALGLATLATAAALFPRMRPAGAVR